MWKAIRTVFWTLKIALPKVAVGWMFALLAIDFNRVAIFELGIAAVAVTTLLSIHYFVSPFQVIAGRLADTYPFMGYRRTPYLLGASVIASLLFLLLPTVTLAMGDGSMAAAGSAILLFLVFGICMAVIADNYHALIAETTNKDTRGAVIAVVWIVMILSTILSAVVMNAVRPEFSPEAMQRLYNLTPLIVIGAVVLGLIGVEKRLSPAELETARLKARSLAPPGNPISSAVKLLQRNPHTRRFFAFVMVAIFGIFLMENLIEVFGAEVFNLSIKETTRFQPIWGGGVLVGMLCMGALSATLKVPKKTTTLIGCVGAATVYLSMGMVALLQLDQALLPTLFILGFFTGIFNVGALALMMDMTVEGATGLYMGLWGVAQSSAMGLSAISSGALHTSLIDTGILSPQVAYWMIFSLEGGLLITAAYVLYQVSVEAFQASASKPVPQGERVPARAPSTARPLVHTGEPVAVQA